MYNVIWLSKGWFVEDCDDFDTAREAVERSIQIRLKGRPKEIYSLTEDLAETNYTIANDYYLDDQAELKKVSLDGVPEGPVAFMTGTYLRQEGPR